MDIKCGRGVLYKVLIILLMINYMVVTIICKDTVSLKYLRDILLIMLVVCTAYESTVKRIPRFWLIGIFAVFVVLAIFRATSISVGITAARRYLFPVIMYFVAYNYCDEKNIISNFKFTTYFFTFLSAWGIFQAYVLKDTFLKNLGYPQVFLPAYGREMLNQAFYFGNFGIQRVTATLSSPNILALIFGCAIIFLLINREYLKKIKYGRICLGVILLAYLLTVSRSNFLALLVVGLLIIWRYIPGKRYIFVAVVVLFVIFAIIGIYQGPEGILYKLFIWVQNSLTFKESSAAGRSSRWLAALDAVINNPLGLGPGYVGSIASNAGKQELYFDCENSYLCLAIDIGVIGCICYYAFLIYLAASSKRQAQYIKRKCSDDVLYRLNVSAFCIVIYVLIVMFFSNHVQDMEAMTFIFMCLGLINGYNRTCKVMTRNRRDNQ